MGKSVIIIGKGPSIQNTTADYVSSFDKIAITNLPVWDGYEKYIPKKAHIQVRTSGCMNLSLQEIQELGLEKIVSADPKGNLPHEAHYDAVEVVFPEHKVKTHPVEGRIIIHLEVDGESLDPATGTIALDYLVSTGEFDKVSLVGFDLMAMGEKAYYFKPHELHDNLKYLYGRGIYDENTLKRLEKSGHDEELTRRFILNKIKDNPQIRFEVTTINKQFKIELSTFRNVTLR